MGLISSGATDIGRKRKTNQDSIYLNPKKNLFVVADGMGGHNGGEIASAMAVEEIPKYIIDHYDQDPKKISHQAIMSANLAIKKHGDENEDLKGMGTTAVSILFRGANLYLGNVGDSRGYLVNGRKLYQLTRDHSLVQEKLNLGLYTREQAQADPHKNVLVRTVGFEEEVEIDVFTFKVHRNDLFLFCSDGLHGYVSDADILYLVNTHVSDPKTATQADMDQLVQSLIDQANKGGGKDNISVVAVLAQ